MQLAVLREEVAHRVVLGGAVVPHGQRARCPAQAGLELRHLGQGKQLGQQGVALHARQALDVAGEGGVHIQHLLARDGVHAHHRVLHRRVLGAGGLQLVTARVLAQQVLRPAADLPGVHGCERLQIRLEGGRQAGVGSGEAGPQRVAAAGRNHLRIQAGAQRWLLAPGDVGMPVARRLGALGRALHDLDFGVVLQPGEERLDLGHVAKAAGEVHLLLRRDVLVAEEQHLVHGQGLAQLGLCGRIQRLAQVQVVDDGADGGGVGLDSKAGEGGVQVVDVGHGAAF